MTEYEDVYIPTKEEIYRWINSIEGFPSAIEPEGSVFLTMVKNFTPEELRSLTITSIFKLD